MTRPLKLLHVLGARPQFIKFFPVQEAIRKAAAHVAITSRVLHTGQHYDYRMSKIFFDDLGLQEPDYHAEVGSGTHGRQTALVLERVEDVLREDSPDVVVVYGDTNSTLGGALAAAKLHIPVAHVEAGLRSRNKRMPEEINRVLTDHLSTFLFCPSSTAVTNLEREGFPIGPAGSDALPDADHPRVVMSGDVMYDVLRHTEASADERSGIIQELGLDGTPYMLLTLHRAENTDDRDALRRIISFVNSVTDGCEVIFPVHPRTTLAYRAAGGRFSDRVRMIEPRGHFDMVRLLKGATRVLTDSGGLQKEAYWLQVPCITLREETEWVETVESGWNVLYHDYPSTREPERETRAYGEGDAATTIVETLCAAHAVETCA